MNKMKVSAAQVKPCSPYSFRADQWATVIGVVIVVPEGKEARLCYHLMYADGVCDYYPLSEPCDFKNVGSL